MTETWALERLVELLDGDADFIEQLYAHGICVRRPEGFLAEEVEAARIAHTLVTELEVNWPGVEIILRMRSEIVETREQLARLFDLIRNSRPS
jgi:hypothetical protein